MKGPGGFLALYTGFGVSVVGKRGAQRGWCPGACLLRPREERPGLVRPSGVPYRCGVAWLRRSYLGHGPRSLVRQACLSEAPHCLERFVCARTPEEPQRRAPEPRQRNRLRDKARHTCCDVASETSGQNKK